MTFPRSSALGSALGLALLFGSTAEGGTIILHPSQDNSIYSESDSSNALGGLFVGATPNLTLRRALMKFNLASAGIPAGATINSVSLDVTQTKIGPGAAATFELHPLSKAWGEGTSVGTGSGGTPTSGDATWNYTFYNTGSWSNPGGDFGAANGSATLGTSNITYTFTSQPGLVADVQHWLQSPGSNFGWIMMAADESVTSARQFGSREGPISQQPALTVTFTPIPEPATGVLLSLSAVLMASRRKLKPIHG